MQIPSQKKILKFSLKLFNCVLCSLVACSKMTNAQIAVTQNSLPPIGTVLEYYTSPDDSNFHPGPAGANQIWTIAFTQPNIKTGTIEFVDPTTTLNASAFPSANYAIKNSNSVHYYNSTVDSFVHLGGANLTTSANHSEITKHFDFPSTYLAVVNNYHEWERKNPLLPNFMDTIFVKRKTTSAYTIDGWGTIILPCGSFQCLRKNLATINVDSFFTISAGVTTFDSIMVDNATYLYEWWGDSGKFILASMIYLDTLGGLSKELTYQSCNPTFIENLAKQHKFFAVVPTVATDVVNLYTSGEHFGNKFTITNMFGSVVSSGQIMQSPQGIDISSLPNGTYIIKDANNKIAGQRFSKY
jgi:hypothetical protein